MACAQAGPLLDHFSALRDPRQGGKVLYPLPEILLLVLCATLAGANDFVATRLWGERALPFLRRFLPYDDGLPSHDTLSDVMNALDPELFKECFLGWVETLRSSPTEADGPEIIAVVLRQAQILWGATGGWDLTLAACSRAGDGSEEKNDGLFPSRHARR